MRRSVRRSASLLPYAVSMAAERLPAPRRRCRGSSCAGDRPSARRRHTIHVRYGRKSPSHAPTARPTACEAFPTRTSVHRFCPMKRPENPLPRNRTGVDDSATLEMPPKAGQVSFHKTMHLSGPDGADWPRIGFASHTMPQNRRGWRTRQRLRGEHGRRGAGLRNIAGEPARDRRMLAPLRARRRRIADFKQPGSAP